MEKKFTEIDEVIVDRMNNWLNLLSKAIEKRDKYEILRLYDFNTGNSSYNWDLVPTDMQLMYDDLCEKGNEILLYEQ